MKSYFHMKGCTKARFENEAFGNSEITVLDKYYSKCGNDQITPFYDKKKFLHFSASFQDYLRIWTDWSRDLHCRKGPKCRVYHFRQ